VRLIDLSHEIRDGMVTYPGIPAPVLGHAMTFEDSQGRYAPGTEFQIGTVRIAGNTGTYIDMPSHRHRDGHDLSGLALESVASVDGIVIDQTGGTKTITAAALGGRYIAGKAVLFRTGWSEHFGTEAYASDHPHIDRTCAEALAGGGARVVGIDSLNIDGTADGERPAHTVLLAAGIPILEHLTALDRLPLEGFTLFAVPPRIAGMASFPVRAFALVGAKRGPAGAGVGP
jgi:kynurenine formamidase